MVSSRQKKWQRIISDWQESGLTKAEYCRRNNISSRKFSYHSVKNKAFSKPRQTDNSEPGSFAEVVCDESASPAKQNSKSSPLVLRLDCGGSIELDNDFNADLLRRLLEVTRELS